MVRMIRQFSNNVPLLEGQGNFGDIDGSSAAAARYPEARLGRDGDLLALGWVNDGAVPLVPNYDGRSVEPALLPVRLPLLLLNGVAGGSIGVGFASQIPPHNPGELIAAAGVAVRAMAEGREPTLKEIMRVMPGPDFATGGAVGGPASIAEMYASGRGTLTVRASTEIVEPANGRDGGSIVVTAVPFGATTSQLVEAIGAAARGVPDGRGGRKPAAIPAIKEVTDLTVKDRATGMVSVQIVIRVKGGESPEVTLEKLYRERVLEQTLPTNFTALSGEGQPTVYTLVDVLVEWVRFRFQCIRRRAAANLDSVRDRLHSVQGLLLALDKIDEVVRAVKTADSDEVARDRLKKILGCTSRQATAILAMQLRRLVKMRGSELRQEAANLEAEAGEMVSVMTDGQRVTALMLDELSELAASRIGRIPRRTAIQSFGQKDDRELVADEEGVVTISKAGYVCRLGEGEFRAQLKGGKGRKGTKIRSDDALHSVVSCGSRDRLFGVTDSGCVVRFEAHEIPPGSTGRHAANLGIESGERVMSLLPCKFPIDPATEIVVGTARGAVKRVMLSDLDSRVSKRLVFFKGLKDGDTVGGGILLPDGVGDVFLASAAGLATRFSGSDVRLSLRDSGGVRGIDLAEGDRLISIERIDGDDQLILCCTSDGLGKRVASGEFPSQNRGGKGRILIKPRRGASLVDALVVTDEDDVLVATEMGMTVRIHVGDIRTLGRAAMGARLVSLKDGDRVISAAKLPRGCGTDADEA